MELKDRLFTIIVTATLTSAAWIVAGATFLRPPADPIPLQPASITPATLLGAGEAAPPVRGSTRSLAPSAAPPARITVNAKGWTIPVANVRPDQLTNTFEQSRDSGARVHNAIDIPAARGTPVVAAAAGVVEKLFQSDDGGKTIYIRVPAANVITYYAHLDTYAPDLRQGMQVRRGQVLGTVGYSGNAAPESPHLHFAVWRLAPGRSVHDSAEVLNPYPLLTGR